MKEVETGEREGAGMLFARYRKNRDGIRNSKEMGSICLICGSMHIVPKPGEPHQLLCRDCGFAFFRYECSVCGNTVDGRDPENPGCESCGRRICGCGSCHCSTGYQHG